MTNIDRSQFYSGGFFLIRAGHPGWEELDAELLPPKLVSVSRCMNQRFDNVWTWIPGNKQAALEFGIPESKWDEFKSWCSTESQNEQLDMYGMFSSKQVAQDCVKLFISDRIDLYLIEVGLPHYLGIDNWRDQIPDDGEEVGVEKRVSQKIPMLDDGTVLGFDVLSYAYHDFGHSWLCNYIHRDMHELYGIKPNQYGFIDTFEDAKKVYDWIAEDDMKGTRAEPIPYDFWLLVSHPLEE
jgi:hypothetical protein